MKLHTKKQMKIRGKTVYDPTSTEISLSWYIYIGDHNKYEKL